MARRRHSSWGQFEGAQPTWPPGCRVFSCKWPSGVLRFVYRFLSWQGLVGHLTSSITRRMTTMAMAAATTTTTTTTLTIRTGRWGLSRLKWTAAALWRHLNAIFAFNKLSSMSIERVNCFLEGWLLKGSTASRHQCYRETHGSSKYDCGLSWDVLICNMTLIRHDSAFFLEKYISGISFFYD